MARVALHGIQKAYGKDLIVHDATFEVNDGEFMVLVGPSGSGKSTTLRMIAGLESITAGRLVIGERTVNDLPPKERDIAMVFQNYALYPHMSVRDNMAFALKLRRMPEREIDQRVKEAADMLGLGGVLDRTPRQLSGGQRQRVAIGRAIVRHPQVFLFDEPLSNLDAKLRVQTRREIASLQRRLGVTTIYVTHDQVEAMTMGDRIVVMNWGRIQQVDTPLGLYDRPRNKFVAGFIGSPAMNMLEGELARDNGGLALRAAGGAITLPLTAEQGRTLAGHEGRAIVAGLRPEDIYLPGSPRPAGEFAPVRLELDAAEPLGNEILLYARAGAQEVTARVAPQPVPPRGGPIELAFNVSRLHFFDRESEARIGDDG